jgi:hypothetical protein
VPPGTSALDLSGITAFNSQGVLRWLEFVRNLDPRAPLDVFQCPLVLVRLTNYTDGLLNGLRIRTVLVPFECTSCGHEAGHEMTPMKAAEGRRLPCPNCGQAFTMAESPEAYKMFASFAPL